jgi:hypothetical protein
MTPECCVKGEGRNLVAGISANYSEALLHRAGKVIFISLFGGSGPLDTPLGKDNFFAAPLTSIATCVHGPAFNHVGPLSMEIFK